MTEEVGKAHTKGVRVVQEGRNARAVFGDAEVLMSTESGDLAGIVLCPAGWELTVTEVDSDSLGLSKRFMFVIKPRE